MTSIKHIHTYTHTDTQLPKGLPSTNKNKPTKKGKHVHTKLLGSLWQSKLKSLFEKEKLLSQQILIEH